MIVLAFDPGHTIGVALLDGDKVILSAQVCYEWWGDFADFLAEVAKPDLIAIEDIPRRDCDKITRLMFNLIVSEVQKGGIPFRIVMPGLWKPIYRRFPNKVKLGNHASDALGLAMYCMSIVE